MNPSSRETLSACEEETADMLESLEDYETMVTKIAIKTKDRTTAGCDHCQITITIQGDDGNECTSGILNNSDDNWKRGKWDYFNCNSDIDEDHHISGCCNFHAGFDR